VGTYSVHGPICLPQACVDNITFGNFSVLTATIIAGNEVTSSNAQLNAIVFANNAGNPGLPLGPVTLTGEIDITYFARPTLTALGTFASQITSLNVAGTFNGHTIQAQLNPAMSSTGQTSVTAAGDRFQVDSFFDVFAELSIDGGPFVPGPVRPTDFGPTPEPGTVIMSGAGIGLMLLAVRRRRRISR
jgi:hypothetical protein